MRLIHILVVGSLQLNITLKIHHIPGKGIMLADHLPRLQVARLRQLPSYARAFHLLNQFAQSTFHTVNHLFPNIDKLTLLLLIMHSQRMTASTMSTYTITISYINQLAGQPNPADSFLIRKNFCQE